MKNVGNMINLLAWDIYLMKSTANLPSPFPGIYETLYPYQQHISFKKCNLSKPGKYGVLHCFLCDASVPYTFYSWTYTGNPDVIDDEANKYCVESSKPVKYGVLYCSLCDATVPYTYCSLPYAGNPDVIDDEANKYCVAGTDNYKILGERLI